MPHQRNTEVLFTLEVEIVQILTRACVLCALCILLGCAFHGGIAFTRSVLLGLTVSALNGFYLAHRAARLAMIGPSGDLRRPYAASTTLRYGALFLGVVAFGSLFPVHVPGLAIGLLSVQAAALTRTFALSAPGRG